jgi:hypothetical protein
MIELLDTVVFSHYTAKDVLIFTGGMTAFLMLFMMLKRIFRKKEITPHFQIVDCSGCGWHGKVSSFAGRCPKCNQPLGDRKAQRR